LTFQFDDINQVINIWLTYIKFLQERVLSMGLRSSSHICQRVISAVVFMYFNMGIMAVNYLDDFGGAEVPDRATI
jgi:hypothetical protein